MFSNYCLQLIYFIVMLWMREDDLVKITVRLFLGGLRLSCFRSNMRFKARSAAIAIIVCF